MATKRIQLEGLGEVTLYKRRHMRAIKLSISRQGSVRVSMPFWLPYRLGVEFAEQKREWLMAQRQPALELRPLDMIGKAHRMVFYFKQGIEKPRTKVTDHEVRIAIPAGGNISDPVVQAVAQSAALRALKKEATELLLPRLAELATQHDFEYRSASIKRMTSRWGSCNHRKEIVLSCFLVQLEPEEQDYVLLHELLHTRILAHGRPFWTELNWYVPDLAAVRKRIRQQQPRLAPNS